MNELFGTISCSLIRLSIILIGIGVVFGFSFGRKLRVVIRWWLILLAMVTTAPTILVVFGHLQKNPPISLQELTVVMVFPKILPLVGIIMGIEMLLSNRKGCRGN